MLGDAGEDIGEPGLRIDVVHLGGDDAAAFTWASMMILFAQRAHHSGLRLGGVLFSVH